MSASATEPESSPIIHAHGIRRLYGTGKATRAALDGVSLDIGAGELVVILGPSGCGKSTLLAILGGLDRGHEGELSLFGTATAGLSDKALASLRGKRIGFVFQAFHLLGHLSALDNVLTPTLFCRPPIDRPRRGELRDRARALLGEMGLQGREGDSPSQMSGGERQRLAIARALLLEPELLLCDEPTGNLDTATGARIVEIFQAQHRRGLTVVTVTHEERLARVAERVIRMRDGRIVDDGPASRRAGQDPQTIAVAAGEDGGPVEVVGAAEAPPPSAEEGA